MRDRFKQRFTGRCQRRCFRRHRNTELLEDRRVLAVAFSEALPVIDSNSTYPKSVVAADFDGDDDADIAIASLANNEISWLENLDGAGTYGEPRVLTTTAIGASSVFAADLDGDGDSDLLSASSAQYDSDVSWYENLDGAGTFSEQIVISADIELGDSVHAADLDGDGDLDVLSASRSDNKVAWYENLDGEGDFSEQEIISDTSEGATSVVAADLDADGDFDVIAGSAFDDTVSWFENDGNATFEEHVVSEVAEFVTAVSTADIDDDGDLDIVSASREDDTISWYSNDEGTFGPERIISVDENGPNELFIGDVDGDGSLDVISATRVDDRVAWYRNDGRGVFEAPRVISEATDGASAVYAVDVDGDRDLDLFSTSRFDNKVSLYENLDGLGDFGDQQVLTSGGAPGVQYTTAADLDGDGDNDVLTAAFSSDELFWQENVGNGNFGSPQLISNRMSGTEVVVAADFDGDGDVDAASASYLDDKIAWYENLDGKGAFGLQRVVSTDAISPDDLHAADVDGDGDMDLLSASRGDDKIAWYENSDGLGNFSTQKVISTTQDAPSVVRTADLDGDGDLDVLASAYSNTENQDWSLSWYPNDGTGEFGVEQLITTDIDTPTGIDAADFDGDGDLDVVSTSGIDDTVAWYENTNGRGVFGDLQIISEDDTADGAFFVDAVDLDRDGDVDLVTISILDDTVGWYENTDGQATWGPLQVISTEPDGPTSVIATDLDGDGSIDVLVSGSVSDDVSWFRNTGDGPPRGDFNGDFTVDDADIDLLCEQIQSGGLDDSFDVNNDGSVNRGDLDELVVNIIGTDFGDSNMDGIFDSSDFVQVFGRGQYEDGLPGNSGWADGDWNCDGEFDTADLVVAFQSGGFIRASRPPVGDSVSPAGADLVLSASPLQSESAEEQVEALTGPAREDSRPLLVELQDVDTIVQRTADKDASSSDESRPLLDLIDAALGDL